MTFPQLIAVGVGLALLMALLWLFVIGPQRRRLRRSRLLSQAFPERWSDLLLRDFALYGKLPADLRAELHRLILVFLDEKHFEACGGLEQSDGDGDATDDEGRVSERLRLLIAAQACVLLFGLKNHGHYPRLSSVLVYPGAFHDARRKTFSLAEDDDRETRLGESWTSGSVVLSADSVLAGARNDDDGMNVVMHEFAHQLDQADGIGDGAPILEQSADFDEDDYDDWARVLGGNYEQMLDDIFDRRHPVLDPYGATNPAEFFAVATETFFEEPERLQREAGELYAALQKFYGTDPATWRG